jgi:hypothetical protein
MSLWSIESDIHYICHYGRERLQHIELGIALSLSVERTLTESMLVSGNKKEEG